MKVWIFEKEKKRSSLRNEKTKFEEKRSSKKSIALMNEREDLGVGRMNLR
jgi:hypothetical protein